MPYLDLRAYLDRLDQEDLLKHITAPVDKDWEISAVGRVAFRDIPESRRPALMFDNVVGYDVPVVLGVLGGSRRIYALALEVEPDPRAITGAWRRAASAPVPPRTVGQGPVKEVVLKGDQADLNTLPVPTWTVGEDPGPYLTAPLVVTKDPETGAHNVGTYRAQIKGPRTLGVWINFVQHGRKHVEMWEARDQPTPVAIVLGTEPALGLCSVARVPYGVEEYAMAGGLRGEAIEVVPAETVDLLVPARAEIVIEGYFRLRELEREGPFGEYTGYMGPLADSYVLDVTCITHRHQPIYHAFLSQMPPSESSLIRSIGRESAVAKTLMDDLRLPVTDVHLLEAGGAAAYMAIRGRWEHEGQARQAILGAWSVDPTLGKICVAVDDDIDIRDPFALNWALSFRMQPDGDVFQVPGYPAVRLDPSQTDESVPQLDPKRRLSTKMGIDATKKHAYPPIAMPPADHLAKVRSEWATYWGAE